MDDFIWFLRGMRIRLRLALRALSGKPMVVVRNSLVVDNAEFYGGILVDADAHAEINHSLIQDYAGRRLWHGR